MNNNIKLDDNILYEGKVRCNKYKGKLQIILTSNDLLFIKRKYFFSRNYILIDKILIKDIKTSNGKILVRQKDKSVEVIIIDNSLILSFCRIDDASDFTNKIIELKKNDTLLKRSVDMVKNLKQEDVENIVSGIAGIISIIGIFSKSKGNKKIGQAIKSSINEIIKFFKNKK